MKGLNFLDKLPKQITFIIIAAMIFLIPSLVFAEKYRVESSIKIGADNHLPPYSYVNDNGIFKGFSLDIIRAIAIEAGIDIEVHPMPWYMLKDKLTSKEIDAAIGMNVNTNDPSLAVSEPLIISSEAIFVHRNNKYIIQLEDLKNVRVAIHRGNVSHQVLNYIDADNIRFADNQQQGIQMMMAGEVDAFVGDKLTGLYTIQKWKQDNFIKIVGDPINEKRYSLVVREEDKDLIKLLNKGLHSIKSNGTYDKIYKKWFGETLNPSLRVIRKILIISGIALIIILIVFILVLRWNSALKKEVGKRTAELDIVNKQLLYQKKQLENADRFKEEILNGVLSGIITVDRCGNITFINSRGLDIFELKKENMLGQNINKTILADFFDQEKIANVMERGSYYRNQEVNVTHGGTAKTFNCNIYPLRESENITGAIINFRDITQEKKLKAELARKDKIQALGLMVAGFAHEIRNPLTSIKTFIDLLPYKLNNRVFREKFMEIVPKEINRLTSLITDLLEYSKPRKPNREVIKVKEILDSIYHLLQKQIGDKSVNFMVNVDENAYIYADKHQIKQVFINLILNSLEAIPHAGLIKVTTKCVNGLTEIIIEDNGKGIPQEHLDKVMDPFFTTKKDGTGLGLFICYQIVQENGGNINIESQIDTGTKVTIKLQSQ
ncbi:MAG: transporter substrate-binding domain-containing protein [Firmicutes bacterium]|jgi:polar amino acid transport system substrate-binding protein|nr:transporter substrate-binding domain-containing protein [Bacillota bacterium]